MEEQNNIQQKIGKGKGSQPARETQITAPADSQQHSINRSGKKKDDASSVGTQIPPVKVGDVLKLAVTRFGNKGNPIVFHKGFVIFLEKTITVELNSLIEIRITKVKPKFAFAEKVNGK